MELKIKFDEKMIAETANRVLDEFKYNGKTIREWADLIANPKTNADRIRAMTDDELAEKLATYIECDMCPGWPVTCEEKCTKYWLDWLKQEVEEVKC